MAEVMYQLKNYSDLPQQFHIVWLTENDSAEFDKHLILAGQKPRGDEFFKGIYHKGIAQYCLLYHDRLPVARGAIEPYSEQKWEAADIRTIKEYRGKGFAKEILRFSSQYIVECGKIATCRTEEDNFAMQRVIKSVGYKEVRE